MSWGQNADIILTISNMEQYAENDQVIELRRRALLFWLC